MVLTNAQTTDFFQNAATMGIPGETVVQFGNEGITTVDNLVDFEKKTIQQVANSHWRPGIRIPYPTPNAVPEEKIPTPSFVFGANPQKRILVACDIVQYYKTTGRGITTNNISWNTEIKNLEAQGKALKERKKGDKPDTPKITNTLPVIKWTQAFGDYLNRIMGHSTTPLSYVVREEVTVPVHSQHLVPCQPHLEDHISVEADLVVRASNTHALYCDNNSLVYYKLEEDT